MRSWADHYITALQEGKTVSFRPKGNSMVPLVNSGDLVTVEPVRPLTVNVGDIVLCKVKGSVFLHLVTASRIHGSGAEGLSAEYQISNNRGHVNGWTKKIFGKVTKVEK